MCCRTLGVLSGKSLGLACDFEVSDTTVGDRDLALNLCILSAMVQVTPIHALLTVFLIGCVCTLLRPPSELVFGIGVDTKLWSFFNI